jgi:hypothetical protein
LVASFSGKRYGPRALWNRKKEWRRLPKRGEILSFIRKEGHDAMSAPAPFVSFSLAVLPDLRLSSISLDTILQANAPTQDFSSSSRKSCTPPPEPMCRRRRMF